MASTGGRTSPSLEEILFEDGFRFDFFEAVRLLERLSVQRQSAGGVATPEREVVRFRSRVSLNFPASAIHEILPPEDPEKQPEMTIAFMGLAGLMGVLPRHYTEMLLERMRQKDFTLRDFLDLFNHRWISLFYRAWEKYRFPVAYERAASTRDRYDAFSLYLFDLIGFGTRGLRDRLDVDGETTLFYAGVLAQRPHSASALEALLGDYFEVPVKTQQFVGQWLPLALEQRACLSSRGDNRGQVGGAVLGMRFWDQQAKFKIRIGPMTFAAFKGFLPGERSLGRLVQLTRIFVGQELDFDLVLILQAKEVPACRLSKPGPEALRLGWSTWLKTKEFARDPGDARLGSRFTRIATSSDKSTAGTSQGAAA
jgi:type VI secretion system protein ImpH